MLGDGPNYLDKFTEVSSRDRHWVELDWHTYLAVYKPDVSHYFERTGIAEVRG